MNIDLEPCSLGIMYFFTSLYAYFSLLHSEKAYQLRAFVCTDTFFIQSFTQISRKITIIYINHYLQLLPFINY